jgi:hypothetical protein
MKEAEKNRLMMMDKGWHRPDEKRSVVDRVEGLMRSIDGMNQVTWIVLGLAVLTLLIIIVELLKSA